ncbi:unnamed protein product [Gongylonema pulchrum]|uniref:Glycoside hydrolase family 31 TIM barrel domain-containing protein n=1 Tax=Gongylonema pulchrum TaxID=637853 RepID=A0A3P7R0P3_9BILA|nr:unnamed protein product [Gongylonema pulchrum]
MPQRNWRFSGGLLFAPKYIQIAAYLPTKKIYGFGEHLHNTLMHNLTKYVTWGMLARDQPPDAYRPQQNLYGVHPFYLALENDGNAHGVLIWNSNAQEVTLGPWPHLVYRTIGGMLDITFFPGPKPEDVIKQYLTFIGKPYLPAYFAFGFQLCRYGYTGLDEMKAVVSRVQKVGVPLDVVYADIDYMERYTDFTVGKEKWSGFGNYTRKLHKDGLHVFLIFDPAIQVTSNYTPIVDALSMGAGFIEWETVDQENPDVQKLYPLVQNTTIMLAVVWPDWHVAFPDFFNELTVEWWIEQFKKLHNEQVF